MKTNFLKKTHRGMEGWHLIALVTFMVIALGLSSAVMSSGFLSSEKTKEVVVEAVTDAHYGLEIIGKMSASANVSNNEILTTATPISSATDGTINLSKEFFKIDYNLIKVKSHIVNYDNIYTGYMPSKSYNSVRDAMADAKTLGLIDVNPYVDNDPSLVTSAFVYWILNNNYNQNIDSGEIAVLAVVYADKDRPSSGEQLLIRGLAPDGKVLTIERTVPNITNEIVDFGGKLELP